MVCTFVFRYAMGIPYPQVLFYVVPVTVAISLIVTLLTKPVDEKTLVEFYKKVRPGGVLWKAISSKIPGAQNDPGPFRAVPAYILSATCVYSALFGIGKLILGSKILGLGLIALSFVTGYLVWRLIANLKWSIDTDSSA